MVRLHIYKLIYLYNEAIVLAISNNTNLLRPQPGGGRKRPARLRKSPAENEIQRGYWLLLSRDDDGEFICHHSDSGTRLWLGSPRGVSHEKNHMMHDH